MHALQFLSSTLALLGFFSVTWADFAEYQNNATHAWKRVEEKDLTPRQLKIARMLKKQQAQELLKRGAAPETCTTSSHRRTVRVGNGNPHQNYYFQQVTGVLNCDGPNSQTYDTSTDVSWSVNVGGSFEWINGGFSVSESYGHGQSETVTCTAGEKQICIFSKVAYTAYTVQPQICEYNTCLGTTCHNDGGHKIFYSPNSNQFGGCYFKGTNQRHGCENAIEGCYGRHTGFWKKCGNPGGPPGHIVCEAFDDRTCGQTCRP